MGKTAVAIDLTESERRELERLVSRRRTAQGLAQRVRIVLPAAEGGETKTSVLALARPQTRWANGGGGSPSTGLMAFSTGLVPARRGRLAMTRSPRRFA
jgi:hypothetical protein